MKKTIVVILSIALSASLGSLQTSAMPGMEDDIAKAEREIELNKIARRISKNTYKRVRQAISKTTEAQKSIKSCEKMHRLTNRTKSLEEGYREYARIAKSTTFEEYIWNECFRDQWPFKDAADRLYKKFWDEELIREIDRLYKGMKEQERKALEAEIREMSI